MTKKKNMKYKLENNITGKVYDLTQENMNEMVKDIEKLSEICAMTLTGIRAEYDKYYINLEEENVCGDYTDCISELARVLDVCHKILGK